MNKNVIMSLSKDRHFWITPWFDKLTMTTFLLSISFDKKNKPPYRDIEVYFLTYIL